jgi:hypothetical protein
VQPLDKHNKVIEHIDTEVEGTLVVDGKTIVLKKILRQDWQKPKGQTEPKLKGIENKYYIDDVPMKQSEYKNYISELTGGEEIFKLLTNPIYFSSVLSWQERRKVLMDIIGDIDDDQVITYNPELKSLVYMLQDKDIETLKRSIAARKKKLNDDLKGIPPRIDELTMSIKTDIDFDTLDSRKGEVIGEIANINEKLTDGSKADEETLADKKRLYELQSKLMEIEQKL